MSEHIFRWAFHIAGLRSDVAGLLAHLISIDGKMPFGSPVSPVLTTHVHRRMFDAIYAICQENGLKMSLWVDDLTISGLAVHGDLIDEMRAVVRASGFQTHKIKFRSGARPVIVTGVPIDGNRVTAPRSLHLRIQQGYADLRSSESDIDQAQVIDRLLSALGTYRYHLGPSSPEGRLTSNRMHSLRQRRKMLDMTAVTVPSVSNFSSTADFDDIFPTDLPWEG